MNDRYCLITGAAGYIGSVVNEFLTDAGFKTVVIDDLREGNRRAVRESSDFYEADYGDRGVLKEIFGKYHIEFVLHLAASASVPDSVVNPVQYYENNVSGTIALLEEMKAHDIDRIIFSSTAAVYGEPLYTPIDERHPLNPINPYGKSKLMDEQIIQDCAEAYGLKYVIFRYFCAAGATENNGESRGEESHIIPLVMDTILGKRDFFTVYGHSYNTKDGTGVRDYIDVRDIARAHLLAIDADFKKNMILNLGTDSGYSVYEVLNAAESILHVKIPYVINGPRPGDPAILTASFNLALKELNWKPSYSLSDIIRSAYAWRVNPNKWKEK